ncbi:MAG: DUF1292 domain-containing protein [Eubacteriales bacterium]|nr:DUF1292 domain-containing protein [Eubacteriales bacterium]
MSEEFGGNFVTIVDEEGEEFELEILDELELDGTLYRAFLPADMEDTDPDFGIILLRVEPEGDEELLASIDDEEELDRVYAQFMEILFSDEEDAGEEPEE